MARSYTIIKNGAATAVTSAGLKTNVAHGNPAGEGPGVGKFSVKVNTTGPVSGNG